jgi:hypothetical protein
MAKRPATPKTEAAADEPAALAIEWWDVSRVRPYGRNPRTIPEAAVEKVAGSIKAFGWRQPIVVDEEGVILAGHTRFKAAQLMGSARVPVHVAEGLTVAQAKAYRLADNRVAEETDWNHGDLKLEVADLQLSGEPVVSVLGFDTDRDPQPLLRLQQLPRRPRQVAVQRRERLQLRPRRRPRPVRRVEHRRGRRPSGSGKTSIGRQIFGDPAPFWEPEWPHDKPIIDGIAPGGDFDAVTGALGSVGLGSVPTWLRPYPVLSNGEKFRADLARLVCEAPERAVVDEFTSVVDRQIAKFGALAFSKAWRRLRKNKVVLLTPHYDVIEWLEPDWVFDTAKKTSQGGASATSIRSRNLEDGRKLLAAF